MRNIVIVSGNNDLGNSIINLLSQNDNIIVISNTADAHKQINEQFPGVVYCTCDITKPNEIEVIINLIIEKYGNIDILINNFESWPESDIVDATYEELANRIDVNTKGPLYVTKIVLEKMYAQGNGLVINANADNSLEKYDYHIISGSGKFIFDNKETDVKAGDSITIEANKSFTYKGKMIIIVEML